MTVAAWEQPARRSTDDATVWIGRLARFGLVCRGLVYLVVALLAVELARGRGAQPDQRGALETIAHHPFGHALVLAMAAGFGCLALWQAARAIQASGPKATVFRRMAAATKAAMYLAVGATALGIALGRPVGRNGDSETVDATARVMRAPLGRPLVAAAGVALGVAAAVLLHKAFHRRYDVELHIDDVPAAARRSLEALGVVGMTARGVIVGLIGYFVLQAAVTFDPGRAKGLDGVLSSVIHQPYGPWLLVLLAAGLACFGCFSLVEARYARG